jgi:hypothetical protein
MTKVVHILSLFSDLTTMGEPEMYHYFEGHHKEDINSAVRFISIRDRMAPHRPDEFDNYQDGYNGNNYNNTFVVRDKLNYADGFYEPWLSQGWNRSSDISRDSGDANAFPFDVNSYRGRPDAQVFKESRPFHSQDPEFEKKIALNEFIEMLLTKDEEKEAKEETEKKAKWID